MTTPPNAQLPAAPAEDPGSQALGDALRSGLRVLRFVMLLLLGVVLFFLRKFNIAILVRDIVLVFHCVRNFDGYIIVCAT